MKQKVFVINLDKRKDRLKTFKKEIKKISFPFDILRIKAVDGSKINLKKNIK
jgi:GR25 family glycosyltransferase involved in LPS biosynthesis